MGTPGKKTTDILPKISRKLATRTLSLVIVFGGLALGLSWFLKVRSDLGGLITSDTSGWIAAVQLSSKGQGQQAVLIKPDGAILKDPGYVANTIDRDITWSPNGNFLYFVSDREEHNFNLFRWSPSAGKAERRTIGTRARSNLKFPAQATGDADNIAKGLLMTGGYVQEFDPVNTSTTQVLPPTTKEIAQGKGDDAIQSQFEGAYGSLGTSFREAEWCSGKRVVAAIMRREAGEILIVQDMQVGVDGKFPLPKPVVAGEHIDLAVSSKDGSLVYCVRGFQWPDGTPPVDKDGKKMKKPFVNGVAVLDPEGKSAIMAASPNTIFSAPAISPDGALVALIVTDIKNGELVPFGLAIIPIKPGPSSQPHSFKGDVHEPSWSPDSTRVLAAIRVPGKARAIYEIPADGSPPRNVTGDTGDFGYPVFSPQKKGG